MRRRKKNTLTRPPVAVIEEVADDIYSVKFILQSLGHPVVSLSYRQNFLPPLVKFKPRVVIVDMMIPGGGGYAVIRAIRAHLKKVPILAITADAMKGEDQDVVKAGAEDYISKPYDVPDLQKKLLQWLPEDEDQPPEGDESGKADKKPVKKAKSK